jgi:hypothetical protein
MVLVCSNYYVLRKWINYKHTMIHIVYSQYTKPIDMSMMGLPHVLGMLLGSSWLLLVLVFIYFDYCFVCCSCVFFFSSPGHRLLAFHIKLFFSETTEQISIKLAINVHWMVLYQICVFGVDRKFNMTARANNMFWLVETLKIFLSETTKPIELWLCRNDHWVVMY